MNEIDLKNLCDVSGGAPTVGGVISAIGLSVAVATAPMWGAVGAVICLVGLAANALSE